MSETQEMTVDEAFSLIARDGRVLRLVFVRSTRGESYLSLTMRSFPLPKPMGFHGPADDVILDAARWLRDEAPA